MLVNFYFTLLFDKFLKRVLFDKTVFFSKLKKKKVKKVLLLLFNYHLRIRNLAC